MTLFKLLVSCPDSQGLVVSVSQKILDIEGNIVESHHYLNQTNNMFFIRVAFNSTKENCLVEFKKLFSNFAAQHKMRWKITSSENKPRILIMSSQSLHCISELLYRNSVGELSGEVIGVLSNHSTAQKISCWHKIPFQHIPVNKDTKQQDLQKISQAIEAINPDVIVLARYMQIIPDAICKKYEHKIINIHHSFLPSFIGANPYGRACDRGVKLIGATCHYVTETLDEGPIIEQDVARVNHKHNKQDMENIGKDIEKITLAKGLQYHLEDRVLICNNRTIIFS